MIKRKKSPTENSLALMRKRGYPLVQVVEKRLPYTNTTVDLFGIIDILCVGEVLVNGRIKDCEVVGVQCTSDSHVANRVTKITNSPALPVLRKAGWRLLVQGWRKKNGRWLVREVDVS